MKNQLKKLNNNNNQIFSINLLNSKNKRKKLFNQFNHNHKSNKFNLKNIHVSLAKPQDSKLQEEEWFVKNVKEPDLSMKIVNKSKFLTHYYKKDLWLLDLFLKNQFHTSLQHMFQKKNKFNQKKLIQKLLKIKNH